MVEPISPAIDLYLEDVVRRVCIDLAGIYPTGAPAGDYGLIFPRKRDGTLRVSEQEAKFLFAQHLAIDKRRFCVETPTLETYQQKGATPMSARVDLTLLGESCEPVAHVELKAHNCSVENIRKDLEKLLRERTTGCWFHTLERANEQTFQALMGKFSRAFSLLGDYLPQVRCSYLFAFFVLDTGLLTFQWLHLTGDRPRDCSLLDAAFSEGHENSAWETMVLRAESPLKRSATKQVDARNAATGKGSRQGFLALIPKVMSDSFVHVSVRGGSYRIRIYNTDKPAARPKALTIAEYPTFDTLRKSEQIVQWIPATSEDLKHNVDDQPQYWCDRIRKLNVKYSSQIDDTRECIH